MLRMKTIGSKQHLLAGQMKKKAFLVALLWCQFCQCYGSMDLPWFHLNGIDSKAVQVIHRIEKVCGQDGGEKATASMTRSAIMLPNCFSSRSQDSKLTLSWVNEQFHLRRYSNLVLCD
ncbi:hypothetical protein PV325_009984 [Microctonus aethiopoides]|nr:hypothetical protein PV325_009984 [Microctonus aethiopoides]